MNPKPGKKYTVCLRNPSHYKYLPRLPVPEPFIVDTYRKLKNKRFLVKCFSKFDKLFFRVEDYEMKSYFPTEAGGGYFVERFLVLEEEEEQLLLEL